MTTKRVAGCGCPEDALVAGPAKLDNGEEVWGCCSVTREGMWHGVILHGDGRLTCTCVMARLGQACWHIGEVQKRLALRAEFERAMRELERQRWEADEWATWLRYRDCCGRDLDRGW